jgi:hypothetical protein
MDHIFGSDRLRLRAWHGSLGKVRAGLLMSRFICPYGRTCDQNSEIRPYGRRA